MSSNGNDISKANATPSAVVNVGFSSIRNDHGESSSRAGSKSSEKSSKRSSERSGRGVEEQVTPSRDSSQRERDGDSPRNSTGSRKRKSGGFLLDSVLANGSPRRPDSRGKRTSQDGQLHVDKRRLAQSRLSGDSSLRGSPLSREFGMDGAAPGEQDKQASSRPPSMDTTQLVQMALNLSESRKRHTSANLQPPPTSAGRRVTSVPASNIGTVRAASFARNRDARVSSNVSGDSNPHDVDSDEANGDAFPIPDSSADNVLYTFSPATLSRAEKARKYFELAGEHRRLLQHLPPLRPSANGTTTNGTHHIGRQYNPIQSLRNRRIRIRDKRPFSAPPDTWHDPESVKKWVDDVESATKDSSYLTTSDAAQLPPFSGDDGDAMAKTDSQKSTTQHRRTDTVGSVITRPENSWTIEPTELLADAYWTEKGDNKGYIETRRGIPIFPEAQRKSVDTPKISVELHRGRSDSVEHVPINEDFEESSKPSRRRMLMLPITGTEKRRHRRLMSRSTSSSSDSTTQERRRKSSNANREDREENVGPLERHMQELIAKDERGELSSPELTSADPWDSKNSHFHGSRASFDKSHRESLSRPEGRASLDVPRDLHRRAQSADGRVGSFDRVLPTTEDLDSEPASPIATRHVPPMGLDISSPGTSRRSLDDQRSRGSIKLPSFRSRSKERNGVAQTDFAVPDGNGSDLVPIRSAGLSTIASVGSPRSRPSDETQRQADFKRHKTNDSMSSLRRLETGSTFNSMRESGSSVGRFLKGGRDRIGGLVFSDRFKNRERGDSGAISDISRTASDIEDLDEDGYPTGPPKRRTTDRTGDDSDASPRDSLDRSRPKPKYHISNLPAFTSSARDKRIQTRTPTSQPNDALGRQLQAHRETGRSERFERLAPPRISLPPGSGSDPQLMAGPEVTVEGNRKTYGQLDPAFGSTIRRNGLIATGFNVPGLGQSKRHWSIYDYAPAEQAERITSRDVARVKALLLTSGIKAREIQRRADEKRDTPSDFIVQASRTSGQPIDQVLMKDEHLVAARMLTAHLTTALADFENTLSRFQTQTASNLASQLDELQHKATEQLSKLVHETSDEADAFTVELTTRPPQQTKQVDDAVDAMLRQRRRQFRLLRKAGFQLLEWFVLSIMWWIWFVVVVFNMGRKVVVGVFRFLHWLFVF